MMELRPMIVNNDNIVLGGNMRLKALKELGYKEIPASWVKSADKLTEEEQRRFIIADNIGFGEHDWDMLANEWDAAELSDWGLDVWQINEEITDKENQNSNDEEYSKKIDKPIYEITGEKPDIKILYDSEKYKELIIKVENSQIPVDVKDFLKVTASRFIVFDYGNIAEYYAHSEKIIQELMEELALVIIDFDKAIELGFVKLSEQIAEQYKNEYIDEE